VIRFQYYRTGTVFGIRYWFEHAGEQLPEHVHDATTVHNTICLYGAVQLVLADTARRIDAGEITDFDGTQPHRIVALEPASILNLLVNGMPEGFDLTQPMDGTLESPQ
jgi:quercetin dioxygenase-like cupin family protein